MDRKSVFAASGTEFLNRADRIMQHPQALGGSERKHPANQREIDAIGAIRGQGRRKFLLTIVVVHEDQSLPQTAATFFLRACSITIRGLSEAEARRSGPQRSDGARTEVFSEAPSLRCVSLRPLTTMYKCGA